MEAWNSTERGGGVHEGCAQYTWCPVPCASYGPPQKGNRGPAAVCGRAKDTPRLASGAAGQCLLNFPLTMSRPPTPSRGHNVCPSHAVTCAQPAATNRQPPTTANRHQPPITNHQHPPTTTNRHQPPVGNRQLPPIAVENMNYTRYFCKTAVQEHFFFPQGPPLHLLLGFNKGQRDAHHTETRGGAEERSFGRM